MPLTQIKTPVWRWLGWISSILITLYLMLICGAWWFVKYHRHVTEVSYLDLALPFRWERYQTKRGDHHIAQARYLLRTGQGAQGFRLLRMGLARSPENRDGRILLAQVYAGNHRTHLAKETLQSGLRYHQHDIEYLAATLRFLIDVDEDVLALALSNRLLQAPTTPHNIIPLAAQSAAVINHRNGNYDLAEVLLTNHGLSLTREGRLLQAQLEWDRGYRSLALVLLRELQHDFPSSEQIYSQLQESLLGEKQIEESRRLALLHQITHPDRPESHLDRIRSLDAGGDTDAVSQAAQNMMAAFAGQPAPLLALGDFAATNGHVAISRALNNHFRQNNLPDIDITKLLLIEALLNAEQYHEVLKETVLLSQERNASTIDQVTSTAKGLAAIAHYGMGDPGSGHAQLTAFMAQPQLRPASLLAIADRLASMGYRSTAHDILAQALQLSPQSQPILTRLLEFSLEDRNVTSLPEHMRTLLTTRRPPPHILTDALNLLHSDQFLFLKGRASLIRDIEAHLSKR